MQNWEVLAEKDEGKKEERLIVFPLLITSRIQWSVLR